jgi:hypothetical protein
VHRHDPLQPLLGGACTISLSGEQACLAVGQTGVVGGLAVTLTKVSGTDVGLEVRRS